jgi:hypothetical protein
LNDTLPHAGRYIVKVEKEDYETTWKHVNFKYVPHRITEGSIDTIFLVKLRRVNLPEVIIKATKIKMVMRGDTIVYNADAFNLQEGSMLDQLIAMLPGAKIDKDGVITVNGRRVSSLLLNGNDFFSGNPNAALKNLPAYVVDKVKVYDKMSYIDESLGYSREERLGKMPMVMDVTLKKQYEVGWFANASVGSGTEKHYAARAFAMRHTRQSSVAIYGNTNDMMGDAYYDVISGNWEDPNTATGLIRSTQAGINMNVKARNGRWKLSGSSIFRNRRNTDDGTSSSVTFLQGGNVFSREKHYATVRQTQSDTRMELNLNPRKGSVFTIEPSLKYTFRKSKSNSLSADFNQQMEERYRGEILDSLFKSGTSKQWIKSLIESLRTNTFGIGHDLTAKFAFTGKHRFNMDQLNYHAEVDLTDARNRTLNHYATKSEEDNRDRFSNYKNRDYSGGGMVSYDYNLSNLLRFDRITLEPFYSVNHGYHSSHNPFYALEGSTAAYWSIDRLASNKDSIQRYIDFSNTYYSTRWETEQQIGLNISLMEWTRGNGETTINLCIPVRHLSDKIDYQRGTLDTIASQKNLFLEPSIEYYFNQNNSKSQKRVTSRIAISSASPEPVQLLTYHDDSEPLVVRRGNPLLNNSRRLDANIVYSKYCKQTRRSWNIGLIYSLFHNQFCQCVSYDKTTGIRTYQPSNINGNWSLNAKWGFSIPLDQQQRWWFHGNTDLFYRNSDDLTSIDGISSQRSCVRRTQSRLTLRPIYAKGDYRLELKASTDWSHSDANLYPSMNIFEMQYSVGGSLPLLFGLVLHSELNIYDHRGYQDNRYNTSEFIWNASLMRSLFHGSLQLSIEAFDMLNDIRSTTYLLNAQMQKESYQNTLHRYAMLHILYRLNIMPKKKSGK